MFGCSRRKESMRPLVLECEATFVWLGVSQGLLKLKRLHQILVLGDVVTGDCCLENSLLKSIRLYSFWSLLVKLKGRPQILDLGQVIGPFWILYLKVFVLINFGQIERTTSNSWWQRTRTASLGRLKSSTLQKDANPCFTPLHWYGWHKFNFETQNLEEKGSWPGKTNGAWVFICFHSRWRLPHCSRLKFWSRFQMWT